VAEEGDEEEEATRDRAVGLYGGGGGGKAPPSPSFPSFPPSPPPPPPCPRRQAFTRAKSSSNRPLSKACQVGKHSPTSKRREASRAIPFKRVIMASFRRRKREADGAGRAGTSALGPAVRSMGEEEASEEGAREGGKEGREGRLEEPWGFRSETPSCLITAVEDAEVGKEREEAVPVAVFMLEVEKADKVGPGASPSPPFPPTPFPASPPPSFLPADAGKGGRCH